MSTSSESLPDEARMGFDRLIVSGSKALEFLGSQAIAALAPRLPPHRRTIHRARGGAIKTPTGHITYLSRAVPSELARHRTQ